MSGFISSPYLVGVGNITYSPEAEAFFTRLTTEQSEAREILYDSLISTLLSAGVWAKLDALYMFAAVDQSTALTNLVSASFGATNVNSTTFTTDVGFTGNGSTMRIDTSWNPNSGGLDYSATSGCAFAWSNSSLDETPPIFGNIVDGANNNRLRIYPRAFGADDFFCNIQSTTQLEVLTNTDGKGFYLASRTASNAQASYKNAVVQASNAGTNDLAVLNDTYGFLHMTGSYSTRQILCGGMGGGLNSTEVTALYNAVHIYLQAVAGIA